ncbi:hypothetical protein GCM10011351_09710 [Paraliobacillus quinghaiensis]|uniref:Uncharacterized protein n=1 Tax=Paraliobacillus quinghaiensis TaxID=470815 RepID=A0A917WSX6_9BACI|nr:hypothetical protein [Paraliobacillus quinghaiensis]GGM26139.1 hypothetical protein GCM10011351_09710 [Paraliobacillus quinghaiensis]
MTKQQKIMWSVGNIILGIISFPVYLFSVFQAWANQGGIALFGIGSIVLMLIIFIVFNLFVIKQDKVKYWGLSVLLFLGSATITILTHGILQNTIFE